MKKRRIAFLHLLPIAGNIDYNQRLIEQAVVIAGNNKVDWMITPELAVSGLQFNQLIGTDWITQQPDAWMTKLMTIIKSFNMNVFLGCPERDESGNLYNSVFVINREGQIIGKQRKLSRIDNWSTAGDGVEPIDMGDVTVGIMICADAYTKSIAETLMAKEAELLVAPSAWGRGFHGPNGEWEQRSIDTGLCVFVCNRTGADETVSFWNAESKIIKNGKCLLTHTSDESAVLLFDWDMENMELLSSDFTVVYSKND